MFRCLNCGFIFKNPKCKVKYRVCLLSATNNQYSRGDVVRILCCPKCGSDAIKEMGG